MGYNENDASDTRIITDLNQMIREAATTVYVSWRVQHVWIGNSSEEDRKMVTKRSQDRWDFFWGGAGGRGRGQQHPTGPGLLIHEVSRSHTSTHHSR